MNITEKIDKYLNEDVPLNKLNTTQLIKKIRSLSKEKGIPYDAKGVRKMSKIKLVKKVRELQEQ